MNFGFHAFWRRILHLTISEPLPALNALFNSEGEQRKEMRQGGKEAYLRIWIKAVAFYSSSF